MSSLLCMRMPSHCVIFNSYWLHYWIHSAIEVAYLPGGRIWSSKILHKFPPHFPSWDTAILPKVSPCPATEHVSAPVIPQNGKIASRGFYAYLGANRLSVNKSLVKAPFRAAPPRLAKTGRHYTDVSVISQNWEQTTSFPIMDT